MVGRGLTNPTVVSQVMDNQPAADCVGNMVWNVKIDAVGQPYRKDLVSACLCFCLMANLAVGAFLLLLRYVCQSGGVGSYEASNLRRGEKTPN